MRSIGQHKSRFQMGPIPSSTGQITKATKRPTGEDLLKPTDIAKPDYFHRVVDCQWACPAHTPVPEYIRMIAAGRHSDAYMVNWVSNVFPGILGRTCDRPCEPACRRGRVEESNGEKPEPVAICRLKRVAADNKDDIRRAAACAGEEKRQALPASVQACFAYCGARPGAARLPRSRIRLGCPRRRHDSNPDPALPAPRVGDRRRSGLCPRYGRRSPARPPCGQHESLIAEGTMRSCRHRAPRGRDLDIPGARRQRRTSTSASTGWRGLLRPHRQDRQSVIVLAAAILQWIAAAPRGGWEARMSK